MNVKVITPALGGKSFSCPHCGAIAHQTWYKAYLDSYARDTGPWLPDQQLLEKIKNDRNFEDNKALVDFFSRKMTKEIFTNQDNNPSYSHTELINLHISQCYSCTRFAILVADTLIYPLLSTEIQANPEMPEDIRMDFLEAASIMDESPRGAAAILRLCIQKLMPHLELEGNNLKR